MAADLGAALPGELRVDGGMIRNELLMQFQADILGRPVVAPPIAETSALGAAYAAGLAVGFWSGLDELRAMDRAARRWEPAMDEADRARRHRPLAQGRRADARLGRGPSSGTAGRVVRGRATRTGCVGDLSRACNDARGRPLAEVDSPGYGGGKPLDHVLASGFGRSPSHLNRPRPAPSHHGTLLDVGRQTQSGGADLRGEETP